MIEAAANGMDDSVLSFRGKRQPRGARFACYAENKFVFVAGNVSSLAELVRCAMTDWRPLRDMGEAFEHRMARGLLQKTLPDPSGRWIGLWECAR